MESDRATRGTFQFAATSAGGRHTCLYYMQPWEFSLLGQAETGREGRRAPHALRLRLPAPPPGSAPGNRSPACWIHMYLLTMAVRLPAQHARWLCPPTLRLFPFQHYTRPIRCPSAKTPHTLPALTAAAAACHSLPISPTKHAADLPYAAATPHCQCARDDLRCAFHGVLTQHAPLPSAA